MQLRHVIYFNFDACTQPMCFIHVNDPKLLPLRFQSLNPGKCKQLAKIEKLLAMIASRKAEHAKCFPQILCAHNWQQCM